MIQTVLANGLTWELLAEGIKSDPKANLVEGPVVESVLILDEGVHGPAGSVAVDAQADCTGEVPVALPSPVADIFAGRDVEKGWPKVR